MRHTQPKEDIHLVHDKCFVKDLIYRLKNVDFIPHFTWGFIICLLNAINHEPPLVSNQFKIAE